MLQPENHSKLWIVTALTEATAFLATLTTGYWAISERLDGEALEMVNTDTNVIFTGKAARK